MQYQVYEEGPITVVSFRGRMTGGPAADEFRVVHRKLIGKGRRLFLFDLSRVKYVTSCGAGVIIGAHTRATEQGGRLKLVVDTERVRNLLHLIQLYRVMEIHETLEEALASFVNDLRAGREGAQCGRDAASSPGRSSVVSTER